MRTLIEHVTVLTMNNSLEVIEDGYIIIEDDSIAAVGYGTCILSYDKKIDGEGGILMPGMINTHGHISMIPFRSLGDDCRDRLRRFLFPLEKEAMTPELVYLSAKYSICEMLLSGVTTVVDMYYFEDIVAKACDEMGIRAYVGETIINMETCDSDKPYGGLEYSKWFLEKWKGHALITPIVAPHAANTNSSEVLIAAHDLARKYNTLFTLHVSEMDYEIQYFRQFHHRSPINFLDDIGVLDPYTLAAHCILTGNHDIWILRERGVSVSHCIGSNTKAGKGVARIKDMAGMGITIGLGTDGPSSGNTLDLFTQFRLFASFHKCKNLDRSIFPASDIVTLGTKGGAKAVHADAVLGSIEVGKKADLVLVETKSVNMFPYYDPYSVLVYSANASNVDTVFVNGKMLVHKKQLVGADLQEIRRELEEQMGEFKKKAEEYKNIL